MPTSVTSAATFNGLDCVNIPVVPVRGYSGAGTTVPSLNFTPSRTFHLVRDFSRARTGTACRVAPLSSRLSQPKPVAAKTVPPRALGRRPQPQSATVVWVSARATTFPRGSIANAAWPASRPAPGSAEVVRGVDQRDMRQRLREISGLAAAQESYSSASSPTSLATATTRSNSACALSRSPAST